MVPERDRFSVADKRALVTGGGGGLGRAIAVALAEHGARVAVLDRDGDAATAATAEIEGRGSSVLTLVADVTDRDAGPAAVAELTAAWGGLDVLVNNAGIGSLAPAERVPLESFRRIYEIDVISLFSFCQAAFTPMARQGGGCIINLASIAGLQALHPDEDAAYHSAKAAVIMLTKALAVEWAEHGIRVNAIAPGFMLTPPVVARQEDRETWAHHMQRTPLGRAGTPRDVQGAAVYLASAAASFVTGTVLVVDGGYTSM